MAIGIGARQLIGRADMGRVRIGAGLLGGLGFVIARLPVLWSAAALGGSALLLGVLIVPAAGLVLLGLMIPFGPMLDSRLPLPVVGAIDLWVGLVVIVWLAQGVGRRRIDFHPPPLTVLLALFVWVAGGSLTQATSWREGLPEWLKWLEFAAVYLVGCQLLTRRSAPWVVTALLAAGIGQALFGIYQFTRQVGPEAFVLMGRYMRAYGAFGQPNPYAGYLGCLLPVAASLALGHLGGWWRTRTAGSLAQAAVYGLVTALLGIGILMSWSRGAWLGMAAAVVVVVGCRSRRSAGYTLAVLTALALLVVVTGTAALPDVIEARVNDLGDYLGGPDPARTEITDANFSVLERLAHWQAGWRMFGDHPWLGVGIGNYEVAYPLYHAPHWYEPLGHAHNIFVNFLAETGVLGAGAFLALWLALPITAWRTAHRLSAHPESFDAWRRAVSVGLAGVWAYVTVHSVFDNLFVQHIQLQLALLMCAVFAVGLAPTGRAQHHPQA